MESEKQTSHQLSETERAYLFTMFKEYEKQELISRSRPQRASLAQRREESERLKAWEEKEEKRRARVEQEKNEQEEEDMFFYGMGSEMERVRAGIPEMTIKSALPQPTSKPTPPPPTSKPTSPSSRLPPAHPLPAPAFETKPASIQAALQNKITGGKKLRKTKRRISRKRQTKRR